MAERIWQVIFLGAFYLHGKTRAIISVTARGSEGACFPENVFGSLNAVLKTEKFISKGILNVLLKINKHSFTVI